MIIYIILFIIGYLLFQLINIEGFRNRPINKYYISSKVSSKVSKGVCKPNPKSLNCSNNKNGGGNKCTDVCKGESHTECNHGINPFCAIDKTKKDDCCIWEENLGCGDDPKLNASTNGSTTKNTKYIKYIIDFDRIPPNKECSANGFVLDYTTKTQSVIFITPYTKGPVAGYPFIMYFEFIDKDGCLEVYGLNTGYGGMIHQSALQNSESGTHFNVLQNMQKVYENCIDNGIGLVIVPDYLYDVRNYMNCSGLGYNQPGNIDCNNNLCWNDGHNPDMYLINQILFNIKNSQNASNTQINPCKWSPDNNNNNASHTMTVKKNMENIHFNIESIGIMGYSVGAHFVSRLIKEWINLKIWEILKVDEGMVGLKIAILIAGGSYNCYVTNAKDSYVDKNNKPISDPIKNCFPNASTSKFGYGTENCPNSKADNKCFKDGTMSGYNPDDNNCGYNCVCGQAINSGRGCCPNTNTIYDGDAPIEHHPPTILLDTQCDAWSDPNATLYYKNYYDKQEDVILLPSKISGDVVHGLVDNQVDSLNKLINLYMRNNTAYKLSEIIKSITYPDSIPGPSPPPPPTPPPSDSYKLTGANSDAKGLPIGIDLNGIYTKTSTICGNKPLYEHVTNKYMLSAYNDNKYKPNDYNNWLLSNNSLTLPCLGGPESYIKNTDNNCFNLDSKFPCAGNWQEKDKNGDFKVNSNIKFTAL